MAQNLRPYMRVSLDKYQGQSFLFRDATEAEVEIRDVPPGVYDVVLFDYSQERARLPKAFRIDPSPLPDAKVVVVGTFGNLPPGQAARITVRHDHSRASAKCSPSVSPFHKSLACLPGPGRWRSRSRMRK